MWNSALKYLKAWGITLVLTLTSYGVVKAQIPPSGMPVAPSIDPFALPNPHANGPPPPSNYQPFAPPMNQPPSPNMFAMQPQFNQYMARNNHAPVYPAVHQGPPPDAAPVGATAPSSSNGEMEFESGSGNSGGGGTASNYVYPPTSYSNYVHQMQSPQGYYSPRSLLDAYYHQPYQQSFYQQQQLQHQRRNDMFGGMFGGTQTGNMFGALMLNELVF